MHRKTGPREKAGLDLNRIGSLAPGLLFAQTRSRQNGHVQNVV